MTRARKGNRSNRTTCEDKTTLQSNDKKRKSNAIDEKPAKRRKIIFQTRSQDECNEHELKNGTNKDESNAHGRNCAQSNDVNVDEARTNQTKDVQPTVSNALVPMDLMPGDIVWAKIKGYPYWPAKIERIFGAKNQMVEVFWFNNYKRTKMCRASCMSFLSNFDRFRSSFNNYIGLEPAAKEAIIYLGSQMHK